MSATLQIEKIQLLAFDVDGTLFSSEEIIVETYQDAIERHQKRAGIVILMPSKEKIMDQIGKPVKKIFQNLLPELSEKDRDSISLDVLNILCEKIEKGKGHIYPNVKTTIETLFQRGYKIVAASNGRAPYILSILKAIGIDSYFHEVLVLNDTTIRVKGDLLIEYKKQWKMESNQIVMIGDRYSDWEAAELVGAPFLFCSFGHAVAGEIPSYSREIQEISELLSIFPGIENPK